MNKSITLLSLIKDGYQNGTKLVIDTLQDVGKKLDDTYNDINLKRKGLKYITREDVLRTARTASGHMAKGARKAVWIGTVATSATAGITSGFILNRIGYEVRTNLMVISEEIIEGKTVQKFVKAPTNKIGLVIDPTDRNLQLLGIATEALGGLIIIAVIATTLNVELSVKEVEVETVKEFNDEC